MRQSSSQPFYKSIDWVTILMYLIMVFFGWLSICGASYNFETEALLSPGGSPDDCSCCGSASGWS